MELSAVLGASSPNLVLVGAVLGAAIVPFATTVGRGRPLRLAMAVLVTAGAVGITYAGTIVVSTVTEQEILPESDALANVLSTTEEPPVDPQNGMKVTPTKLGCNPECESPITIKNIGLEPLVIKGVEFQGEDETSFTHDGNCDEAGLDVGEACELNVQFNPDGTNGDATTTLDVRNDLSYTPASVSVTGNTTGPAEEVDLEIDASAVSCTYENEETMSVAFRVTLAGSDESRTVPVKVTTGSDSSVTVDAYAGDPPETTVAAPLSIDGEEFAVAIAVDPDDAVAEADDSNNTYTITALVPSEPKPEQGEQICSVE
jgi:hypothetical protein